jgi:hypothetical protein
MSSRPPAFRHRRTRRLRPALLAGVVALLAGCAGGVTTYRSEGGNPSAQLYAPYAAMNGPTLAIVRNDPFPGDPAGLAVIGVMNANNPMRSYHFAPAALPGWNGYTVVFAFGVLPPTNISLCQNTSMPLPPMPPGEIAVIADLCMGPELITEVYGHTGAVDSPEDPRFADLVSQTMEDLFAIRQHYPNDHGYTLWQ